MHLFDFYIAPATPSTLRPCTVFMIERSLVMQIQKVDRSSSNGLKLVM